KSPKVRREPGTREKSLRRRKEGLRRAKKTLPTGFFDSPGLGAIPSWFCNIPISVESKVSGARRRPSGGRRRPSFGRRRLCLGGRRLSWERRRPFRSPHPSSPLSFEGERGSDPECSREG